MKTLKKTLIVLSAFFLFTSMQYSEPKKPESLKKACSLLALTIYDNAINSEVDIETAFAVSQIAYLDCMYF
ncbi:hypothetical protein ITJ86_14995 [Winogradskyella sp. F6397]|uniref:Uncharacterized protein n=1 Tax=Winogradskyella marina TaxID=2785530 RepID=A0ABS0EL72_9FLAO|nr:hypothetical protein [Winogradskyella marina]MBF8151214.1 hypothetical protein [Winogradskyella marina]